MTLKEELYNIIEEHFDDLSKEDKRILNQMSFRKTLNNNYYKNQYKNTFVIELEDEVILSLYNHKNHEIKFFTNYNPEEEAYNYSNNEYDDDYYEDDNFYNTNIQNNKNVKSVYLSDDDFQKVMLFLQKIKKYDEVSDFKSFINREINKNPDYINEFEHLSYLLGGYSFEQFISQFKKRKFSFGRDAAISNEDYHYYKNELNLQFFEKFKNESEYYSNNHDDLVFIENELKLKKPDLFEQPNLNEVEYVFFEITPKSDENGSYIKAQSNLKAEEYKKSGITIYNDELKEKIKKWYNITSYSEKDLLLYYLYAQKNEISEHVGNEFLGFDYISHNTFSPNSCSRSFLLAMKNNEVIGSLVYQDYDYNSGNYDPNISYPFKSAVTANVKKNYRGLGLSALLYKKLSEIMMKEKFIYINTYYSDLGYKRLLNMKSQLNKENEMCFFLDTDFQDNSFIKDNSSLFVSSLKKIKNYNLISDNIVNLKNIYNNNISEISKLTKQKENGEINIMTLIKEIDKITEKTNFNIEKLIKPKLKNKKLKI